MNNRGIKLLSKKLPLSLMAIYCALFVCMAFTFNLSAQSFSASVSKNRVAVGEQFQINYSLNTGGSSFRSPNLNDFDVYSGPNQSTSMQFVNGSMSQSISYSFIIAAKKEGKLVIPPASIIVNGNKVESNSIAIEVGKGNSANNNSSAQSSSPSSQGNASNENIFARTSTNKTKAYVGEQITISHKIYTRLSLRGFQDVNFPAYDGFWSQDLPQQGQITLTTENVDGVTYNVAELKRSFLFAQKSGTLEIPSLEAQCIVLERTNSAPQSLFDQFFGNGGYKNAVYSVKSKPIKIEVMPLPENGKPSNFSGAVGDYSFKAEINKNKIKANDAINLNIKINGTGNLKLIDPPKMNFPEDIETYDPKISENIGVNPTGISGSKSYEYLIIPRHEGNYKIDNVGFSYFDPNKKSYITLPSPEFNITVDKAEENANNPTTAATTVVNKEDVKMIGTDIRYIKTNKVNWIRKEDYFFGSQGFAAGLVSPLILLFSFVIVRKKYIAQNSDVVSLKKRKANKMARKRLSNAKNYLASNNKEVFYEEIFKALYGYLGDKINMPVSELSKDNIKSNLLTKKVSEQTSDQLIDTLSNCEYARYASSAVDSNLEKVYNDSVELISKLENEIS